MLFISWADLLVRTFILIEDKAVLLLMTRYIVTIVIEVRFAISPITASATMASFTLTATVIVIITTIWIKLLSSESFSYLLVFKTSLVLLKVK